LRRPRRTLAVALLPLAVLVYLGFGLEQRLTPSTLDIDGTPVHRANGLLGHYFGDSAPFVVFLRGDPASIDPRGRIWFASSNATPGSAPSRPGIGAASGGCGRGPARP
jgi:hypothetical protein